jgi:hypothetical protein
VLGIVDISGGHRCEAFDDTAPRCILGDSNRHVTTKITPELSDCARKANSQSSQTWTPVTSAGAECAMRPADSTQHKRALVAHAHRNLCLFSERLSARLRCLSRPVPFNLVSQFRCVAAFVATQDSKSALSQKRYTCTGRLIGMIHKAGRMPHQRIAPLR